MTTENFQVGDSVQLKSGGREMTVDELPRGPNQPEIRCSWFDKGERKSELFSPGTLKRFEYVPGFEPPRDSTQGG